MPDGKSVEIFDKHIRQAEQILLDYYAQQNGATPRLTAKDAER